MEGDLSNYFIALGKKVVQYVLTVYILSIVLLACCFIVVFFFHDTHHSYINYVISNSKIGCDVCNVNDSNDVLFEEYCKEDLCNMRISIQNPNSSNSWVPVFVYSEYFIGVESTRESWESDIKPNLKWMNSNELSISINKLSQIIYRNETVDGRKVVFSIGSYACPEVSNENLAYRLGGIFWSYFGPDSQCKGLIGSLKHAQDDVARGVNKADVWKRLHEQGVTDQEIWRIGL